MSLTQLTLENLSQLKGGMIERMLAHALNRISMDLQAAPELRETRRVVLEIMATPICEEGELSDVVVDFAVGSKMPKRITSARMVVRSSTNGSKQLFFALDAPDNPAQMSFLPPPGEDDLSPE